MFILKSLKFKLSAMSMATRTHSRPLLVNRFYSLQLYNFLARKGVSFTAFSPVSSVLRRHRNVYSIAAAISSPSSSFSFPYTYQRSLGYGRFAYDDYPSEEDSDREVSSSSKQQMGDSTLDNIEEWRSKLTMLMCNKNEQEVVSRDKKDRRDFEQLSALAIRMGLHSGRYEKVVVFSKLPLPNYRSDLDEKRPQREVMLPIGLQRRVESNLRAHLSRKATMKHDTFLTSSAAHILSLDGLYEPEESSTQNVIAETIARRRSLQMHNKQQDWQESPEGQKMQ